jgi:hypothetical protein
MRRALAVVLTLAMGACGGGSSSPTSPTTSTTTTTTTTAPTPTTTPVSTPTPTPVAPSNFGVFTFSFDAGTSVADQALIGEAVQLANDYFTSALGRTLSRAVEIRGVVSAQGCGGGGGGGAAAFTGIGFVTICMANQGWNIHGPIIKRKVVVHEVYHALQFERRWIGQQNPQAQGPMWLIEGVPELIAYRALDSRGLLSYSTAQGCQVKEFSDFALRSPPGLPNLNAVETPGAWGSTQGPLYALAMTGVDQLISSRGLGAFNTYMDSIANGANPWETAFQSAFGQTASAFYAQFPSYRSSLTIPSSYQCGV